MRTKKLIIWLSILILVFTNVIGSVSAKEIEEGSITGYSSKITSKPLMNNICSSIGKVELIPSNEEGAEHWKEIAFNSNEFKNFEQLVYEHYGEVIQPRVSQSYIVSLEQASIGVYIPFSGGTEDSFFGIWFDIETEEVIQTVGGIFVFDSNEDVSVRFEANGTTVLNATITQKGEVVKGVAYDNLGNEIDINTIIGSQEAQNSFWSCVNNCLAQNGVPLYLITGLSIVCAIACVITAGLGCLLCIAAALGAWSGVGIYCVDVCT